MDELTTILTIILQLLLIVFLIILIGVTIGGVVVFKRVQKQLKQVKKNVPNLTPITFLLSGKLFDYVKYNIGKTAADELLSLVQRIRKNAK